VNRWALMAEFYIHPVSREGLESYSNKIPQEGKNQLLTDGMKQHRQGQITDLMRTCIEEVKPLVNNCFGERWGGLAIPRPPRPLLPLSPLPRLALPLQSRPCITATSTLQELANYVVNLRWKGLRIAFNTVLFTIYSYRLSDTLSSSCTRV
jgi:hypothetical protein